MDLTQQLNKLNTEVTKQEFQIKRLQGVINTITGWRAIITVVILQYVGFISYGGSFWQDTSILVKALVPSMVWLLALLVIKLITIFRK